MKAYITIEVILASVLFASHSWSAESYLLSGQIEHRISFSGEATFGFLLSFANLDSNLINNVNLQLVSPTGVRYGESQPTTDSILVRLQQIQPADVDSLVSGQWIIEEHFDSGQLNKYAFEVPSILNSTSFLPTPNILTPANGEVVEKTFDLHYTNPHPTRYGFSIIYENPAFQGMFPDRERNAPGNITFSFENIAGIEGATVSSFSVINQEIERNILRPNPLTFGANARFDQLDLLAGNFAFNSFSPPISFRFVPEPASLLLVGLAIICATNGRRFKKIR